MSTLEICGYTKGLPHHVIQSNHCGIGCNYLAEFQNHICQDSVMPLTYGLCCIISDWNSSNLFKILLAFVRKQGKELWDIAVCLLQLVETVQAEDFMSPSQCAKITFETWDDIL